jgi:hypothetical protein
MIIKHLNLNEMYQPENTNVFLTIPMEQNLELYMKMNAQLLME